MSGRASKNRTRRKNKDEDSKGKKTVTRGKKSKFEEEEEEMEFQFENWREHGHSRSISSDEGSSIDMILVANGISLNKFRKSADSIRSLELFFAPLSHMGAFKFFPGLGIDSYNVHTAPNSSTYNRQTIPRPFPNHLHAISVPSPDELILPQSSYNYQTNTITLPSHSDNRLNAISIPNPLVFCSESGVSVGGHHPHRITAKLPTARASQSL